MQMSELMMSSPHNFPCLLFTEITKIPYHISATRKYWKLALYLLWINAKCLRRYILIWGHVLHFFFMFEPKIEKFQNYIYKIHGKLWGDDIFNLLICIIHIDCSKMFSWKLWKFKDLPYFLSNLHQIFTILFEMFYSFYWINLNPDQSSPLKRTPTTSIFLSLSLSSLNMSSMQSHSITDKNDKKMKFETVGISLND